jgi:hypothetical protein
LTKKLKIRWPWHRVEQGRGFFVPCLDTETLRREGLHKAMEARVFNAHAIVGVHAGRYGLLFFRGAQPPIASQRKQSAAPASP